MNDHPFEIGSKYRNRHGDYEVISISDPMMRIRYDDGTEQTVKIAIQARIWENIEAEIAPPPRFSNQADDSLNTYPIQELVQEVLRTITRPYSEDVIYEVCLAIERNEDWLNRYYALVEHFSSHGKNGRLTVNSSIGWFTKDLTGLASLSYPHQAKDSNLIKTYTKLTSPKI